MLLTMRCETVSACLLCGHLTISGTLTTVSTYLPLIAVSGLAGYYKCPPDRLSPEQIQAAGVELAVAGPRRLERLLSLPGEIRFDEDRTSHIVPRAAGVVASARAR